MNPRSVVPRLAAAATLVAVMAIGPATAPAQTGAGTLKTITAKGVGGVKIGKSYTTLRKQKLIGKIRPGCELGGPNTRGANLKKPLSGSVDFTQTSPRKVTNITIRGGAGARGVGIGSTIPEIQAAFPKAKVDHSTEEVFAITLVKIPKSDGGKFEFAVETSTGKASLIGIPFIAFCE
jgi:hypothetical protein